MKKKTLLSWSTGKDCAWALHVLRQNTNVDIVGLFCTVNQMFDRVAMHGVRIELLKQQAKSVGLPLKMIQIPYPCSVSDYAHAMTLFVNDAKNANIECFAFGDLFLENVRKYREESLNETGITPIFPLWGMPTNELSKQMVSNGLKAVITCLDPKQIAKEFAGREYNESFLNDISENIDPCGENGEFHSFAFDGPMFQNPIEIVVGETINRDGFYFTDILSSMYNIKSLREI